MKSIKHYLVAGTGLALAAGAPAGADGMDTYFPHPIHDILITSNIPMVNIGVRNMAASTDPADRDLRVISSNADQIAVSGQLWCNNNAVAERVQVRYGQLVIHDYEFFFDGYSHSAVHNFNDDEFLEDYQINGALQFPSGVTEQGWFSGFNPVNHVEERLEHYLEQNAGTAADFLRVDDVFQVELTLNVVGWCSYTSQYNQGEVERVGYRAMPIQVHIFYHGDPDIQDQLTVAQTPGSIAQPVENRARRAVSTRGSDASPPARDSRPARASRSRRDNKMLQARSKGDDDAPASPTSRDADESEARVSPIDALIIINDAADEGQATPIDALAVINHAGAESTTDAEERPDADDTADARRASAPRSRGRPNN